MAVAPWVVELILTYRILAVFPPSLTSRQKLCAIFAFPVAVKAARLTCIIIYYHQYIPATAHLTGALGFTAAVDIRRDPYVRTGYFLELFDNMCVCH